MHICRWVGGPSLQTVILHEEFQGEFVPLQVNLQEVIYAGGTTMLIIKATSTANNISKTICLFLLLLKGPNL